MFGLKIFEIDLVIEITKPGGWKTKNCADSCAIHESNSHTNSG